MLELILGGARSGKSRFAEDRAKDSNKPVTYIATASAGDSEMHSRIKHHQANRPTSWQLIEEPIELARAIEAADQPESVTLIDCLTLWITNLLMLNDQSKFDQAISDFLIRCEKAQGHLIIVSNETGMGVVPMGELSRRFVDESGWLHQRLGQLSHKVTVIIAGLPLSLK